MPGFKYVNEEPQDPAEVKKAQGPAGDGAKHRARHERKHSIRRKIIAGVGVVAVGGAAWAALGPKGEDHNSTVIYAPALVPSATTPDTRNPNADSAGMTDSIQRAVNNGQKGAKVTILPGTLTAHTKQGDIQIQNPIIDPNLSAAVLQGVVSGDAADINALANHAFYLGPGHQNTNGNESYGVHVVTGDELNGASFKPAQNPDQPVEVTVSWDHDTPDVAIVPGTTEAYQQDTNTQKVMRMGDVQEGEPTQPLLVGATSGPGAPQA